MKSFLGFGITALSNVPLNPVLGTSVGSGKGVGRESLELQRPNRKAVMLLMFLSTFLLKA